MSSSQFFALAAIVYLAPRVSERVGWTMVALCLVISVIYKIGEGA